MEGFQSQEQQILRHLRFLYGDERAASVWSQLAQQLTDFRSRYPHVSNARRPFERLLTERDAVLITYGDQFREPDRPPLQSLHRFMRSYLGAAVTAGHILPFFPYSSDDGFSVIDYLAIDPALGSWDDITAIGRDYRLMFDAVVNHISRHSVWFQGFLRGADEYANYFIPVDPDTDLSQVVRPRALPLLTPVETAVGTRYVWTTFSADQIDLNYADPDVLLAVTDVLLAYVAAGAEIIRLDAVAFLWKEIGTSCLHLPQTHAVVKFWRAVLDLVAPNVILITETNVPHVDNVSYFGQAVPETGSTDEAQMVYNFSLAPLVLNAFQTGNASRLAGWVESLASPPAGAAFFNFIASHDGIGMRPAENLLPPEHVQALIDQTLAHGGMVSQKTNADGSRSAYELNITLYDFLNNPSAAGQDLDVRRFVASQAILLSLAGVPGLYVHSLFGTRNCDTCVAETGRARSINRQKFDLQDLERRLADPASHQTQVFDAIRRLLALRQSQPAFHPGAAQRIVAVHPALFALVRDPHPGPRPVLCLISVTDRPLAVEIDLADAGLAASSDWHDLVGGRSVSVSSGKLTFSLEPYQVCWLVPTDVSA